MEDYLFPEDLPFVRQVVIPSALAQGRWTGDFRVRHVKTGEAIAVRWDLIRVDDPVTGEPVQFATVTRDIRTEKAAEESLREASRRKDEFLAMLGHELRNPMAPIRSAVEALQLLCPGDQQVSWALDVIDRQTAHMRRLVDDLLDVSRIVRGHLKLERRAVALAAIVQQAEDGVRHLMQDRHHRLQVILPPDEILIEGDPVRLAQVLLNLLTNAANYTHDGGEIRLTAEASLDTVTLRVQDNGQGIHPDLLPRIFEAFTQDRHRPGRTTGTLGLGLAVAQRLVLLHGGTIEARSPGLGQGAEFLVRLPRLTSDPAKQEVRGPRPRTAGGRFRVLVVDDCADLANAVSLLLRLLGYEVTMAGSGEEALRLVREFRPRAALLDIGMEGMNGLELARRLRLDYPHRDALYLIAMTGYGHEEARARSQEAGFDEHLVKPVDAATLLALLGRLA